MSGRAAISWRGGGCHCRAVRFEVALGERVEAQDCNCSICAMSGFIHIIVPESRFRLLSGGDALTTYSFNTHTARHLFCRICGVKSFYRPRSNPDGWSVNAKCLDDATGLTIDIEPFDGAHFEAHAGALAQFSPGGIMTDVLMPALSPTMEEGTLAKWLVKVGDAVKSGDVIAEIETDKATMEVEAADEGVVEEILVPEGTEEVKINTPIARLRGEGEAGAPPPSAPKPSKAAPAAAKSEAEASPPPPAQSPAAPEPASGAAGEARQPAQPETPDQGRIFASPLARRLAAQMGVDLASVKGSGPHGRIIRRDVEGLTGEARPAAPAKPGTADQAAPPSPPPAAAKSLEQMGIAPGSYDLIPLDGMKKTVARRMSDSFRDVPHFPLTVDMEIDALLAVRTRINALLDKEGVKVSVNDMVIKAAAAALTRVPEANASYTPGGIAMHHHADIAVAVAVEGGLITPIVRCAEAKGLAQIATEMKELAARARDRKLKPEEYQGGTFSVSNLGMFGIKSFASIINEPQGAILSVGAGERRPVARGDEIAAATVMTVTLTCDHRVVDGAIGARWLSAFKAMIEDPIVMIV